MKTVVDDRLGKTIYADNIKLIKGKVLRTPSGSVDKAGLQILAVDRSSLYEKLDQIGSDNIVTPIEKRSLEREWSGLTSSKNASLQKAEEYEIIGQANSIAVMDAYDELESYLNIVLDPAYMSENTDISGLGNISDLFEAYYTAKTRLDEQLFKAESGIIGGLDDRVRFTVDVRGPNAIPVDGSSVTLSVMLLNDGQDVTSLYQDTEFTWQRLSDDIDADLAWRGTGSVSGKSIQISKEDLVDGYANMLCKFQHYYTESLFFFKTGSFPVSLEIPGKDGEDAIAVQIFSSNGNVFRDGQCFTTMSATVWKGDMDITGQIDASKFTWERTSSNAVADESWNTSSKAIGRKTIELTPDDVEGRSVFACHVEI